LHNHRPWTASEMPQEQSTSGSKKPQRLTTLYLYQIDHFAARKICEEVVTELSVENADCYLVSKIGMKITEPQIIEVALVGGNKESKTKRRIEEIVQEQLNKMPDIWRGFMNRSYELY